MKLMELPFVKMSAGDITSKGPQKDHLGWIFILQWTV